MYSDQKSAPVLMIGLDAAESSLVDRLCRAGKLPVLQALRARGCWGELAANATIFAGGVWPTFYTATDVPWHGIYHNKLWRHEHMRCEVVRADWLPANPFWVELDQAGYRVAAIDVPMTVSLPALQNSIQLSGWGTHDLIAKGSAPPELWKQLAQRSGPPSMPPELFGAQNAQTLLALRKKLLAATDNLATLGESLLVRQPWDLFLIVFGATHRGGHYLWDLSQIDTNELTSATVTTLENSLIEIYQACDRAIGRLMACAPSGTRVMVFAVHGMGPNQGWSDRCDAILAKIQQKDQARPPKKGLLYSVKQAIPWELARQVTTRLPQPLLDRLVGLWSRRMFDWRTTPIFPLPMDHAGYFRVNLKGREPDGIVEPGQEYQTVCRELVEALCTFRDIDTDKPIVGKVYYLDDLAPADAPCRALLPDVIVTWQGVSAIQSRGLHSGRYGEVRWANGKLRSGRAGNHRANGWFVAAGPGIPQSTTVQGYRTIDLAPTVFCWLQAQTQVAFQGRPIGALCGAVEPIQLRG